MVLRFHVAQVVAEGNDYLQPKIGDRGCNLIYTDAAREDGTGYGGFSVVRRSEESRARFYILHQLWGQESLRKLQANLWSIPAGEMFGAAMIMLALGAVLPGRRI